MLMSDPESSLREVRRVLRPGARLALAAWTGPEENRWSADLVDVLVGQGHLEPSAPGEPGQFTWAPAGAIAEHLEAAGFVDYDVDRVAFELRYASVEDWLESQGALSMRIRDATRALDPEARQRVLAELGERAAPWRLDDGTLAIPARTWVAAAAA
jgi:SAM-dependent methyltransferase